MPVAIIISCITGFDFDFGLRFYVQLDIKIGHFRDLCPSQSLEFTEETKPNAAEANIYPEHRKLQHKIRNN